MSGVSLRTQALRLLARREHSRLELERKLRSLTADAGELAALLDEFQCRGWLSEARVAEQHLVKAQGRYGPRRVLSDLKVKGLSAEAISQAAAVLKQSELDNARHVWRKRFGQAPADHKDYARQARFLAGRGFSAEVIRVVLGAGADED